MRHLSFLYPPFVALAGATAATLWNTRSPFARSAGRIRVLCLGTAMIGPIAFSVRNHPNEGMYFNEFVGGPSGAFGRYEMDYWASSVHEAVRWIHENGRSSCGPILPSPQNPSSTSPSRRRCASATFVVADPARACLVIKPVDHDPRLMAARMSSPEIVHAVAVDGAPLSWIVRAGGAR